MLTGDCSIEHQQFKKVNTKYYIKKIISVAEVFFDRNDPHSTLIHFYFILLRTSQVANLMQCDKNVVM